MVKVMHLSSNISCIRKVNVMVNNSTRNLTEIFSDHASQWGKKHIRETKCPQAITPHDKEPHCYENLPCLVGNISSLYRNDRKYMRFVQKLLQIKGKKNIPGWPSFSRASRLWTRLALCSHLYQWRRRGQRWDPCTSCARRRWYRRVARLHD